MTNEEDKIESPLSEANPRSIEDLFEADPLDITQVELTSMVEHYRENRAAWSAEDREAKASGRSRQTSKYKEPSKKPDKESLKNLDLDLGGLGE